LIFSQKQRNKIPNLPSQAYWHTLEDVLTQYVRHNDNKFDYDNEGIAHRKQINADRIRYIGKESNNLEDNLTCLLNNSIKIIIQRLVYHSISMTFFISIN
jgi:hypothetical protein